MTKQFQLLRNTRKNEWLGGVTLRKTKQTTQMFLRLFSSTYWREILSILICIQNVPRNPLWFSSHRRLEFKHHTGTALTKPRWEEVLHSNELWTLVILVYSAFHTLKVWGDKEPCSGQFWNPSISVVPEWTPPSGKAFCPCKYHSVARGVMPPGMLQYVFQRTFPWGKRQNIALVSNIA